MVERNVLGSVGVPPEGTEIKIVHFDSRIEVPEGQVGVLVSKLWCFLLNCTVRRKLVCNLSFFFLLLVSFCFFSFIHCLGFWLTIRCLSVCQSICLIVHVHVSLEDVVLMLMKLALCFCLSVWHLSQLAFNRHYVLISLSFSVSFCGFPDKLQPLLSIFYMISLSPHFTLSLLSLSSLSPVPYSRPPTPPSLLTLPLPLSLSLFFYYASY